MDITELFKDAFKYPTIELNKVLVLGALLFLLLIPIFLAFIFAAIPNVESLIFGFGLLYFVYILILFGIYIVYFGYGLSIVRKTIALEEGIPDFDWGNILADGVKVLVLGLLYMLIPFIFIFGSMYLITAFNMPSMIFVVGLIGFILELVFGLLLTIAIAKLAETDNLVDALNFINIFDKIGEIGWANYIVWAIVLVIIFTVVSVISLILGIFIIGFLIIPLLIVPYMLMFYSRALGLLYNESRIN